MRFSNRLADLNCPRCDAQQPHGKLLRTMMGTEDFLKNVTCASCHAKLRIRRGDGVIHFVSVASGVMLVAWLTGLHRYSPTFSLSELELTSVLEALLRFGAALWAILAVIIPVSANFLTVEQTK